MKRRVVTALVRLYPARWRAEYGEELAQILMRRRLGVAGAANVIASAAWQQLRMQEPWVLITAPLLFWLLFDWALVFTHNTPVTLRANWVGAVVSVGLPFSAGLWTFVRTGKEPARAAMKMAILLALPHFIVGLSVLIGAVHPVVTSTGATVFRFAPAGPGERLADVATMFLFNPILQIPFCGVFGWLGGLGGRVVRRFRQV
jgi:hypothetical protein